MHWVFLLWSLPIFTQESLHNFIVERYFCKLNFVNQQFRFSIWITAYKFQVFITISIHPLNLPKVMYHTTEINNTLNLTKICLSLSFRVFGLLSSSSLLYSQCFGWCIFQPSYSISCQTWEPTWNYKPNPLFKP